MRGRKIWRSELGVGSFVTLDIGGRRVNSVGHEQGEFYLWVYGAPWLIFRRGEIETSSSDPEAQMRITTAQLAGRTIRKVSMDPIDLGLDVSIDGEIRLSTSGLDDPELEDWMLFMPDGTVLTAQQGILTLERADAPPG